MNFKKNILLFNNLILYKFTKKNFFTISPIKNIQKNIEQSHKMYKEVAHSKKLKSLLL